MKSIIATIAFIMLFPFVYAQSTNLFDWSNGDILVKKEYLPLCDGAPVYKPSGTIYSYKDYSINYSSYQYTISLIGTIPQMHSDGIYDGLRIRCNSKDLLLRWGNGPFYDTRYLTCSTTKSTHFIQVPLDDESFALIFGGWLFQVDDEAGEMVIVIIKKYQAKVVFDGPAYAYRYAAPPNFSMEFVDDVNGLLDDYGKSKITDAALKPHTKHKIWREGNMLKYKTWK